jgi:hypothetical protein
MFLKGVESIDDLVNLAPERAFIAQQKYDTAAAHEAVSGDITRAVLRQLNVGAGATSRFLAGNDPIGQSGTLASTALKTVWDNTIGNIVSFLTKGTAGLKYPTQIYYENLMAKEAIDLQAYGDAIRPASEQVMKRMNMFADVERFGGSDRMQSALTGLRKLNITADMARPMIRMLMEAGVMVTPGDADLILAQQRLGVSDNFMRQVARQRFMGGNAAATEMLNRFLDASGLTEREHGRALGVLSEALGSLMSQTVGYDLSNTGAGMVSMVGAAIARQKAGGTLTAEEATRGAVTTYSATQGLFQSGGVYNAVEKASLARMGVTHPMTQYYIQTMLEKGNFKEAGAAIERATLGRVKADQALARLNADTSGMARNFMRLMFDESDPQVRAIGAGKLQAMAMMGKEAVMNKSIEDEFNDGLGGLFKARYYGTGIKQGENKDQGKGQTTLQRVTSDKSDLERFQTAQAGYEAKVDEAAERLERGLGRTLASVIADGFSDLAASVRKSIDKFEKDKAASDRRTQRIVEKSEIVQKALKTVHDPHASLMNKIAAGILATDDPPYDYMR